MNVETLDQLTIALDPAAQAMLAGAIIIIALPILLWDDLRATRRGSGAPDWYLGVRTPLTILMTFSFVIAFAQTMLG